MVNELNLYVVTHCQSCYNKEKIFTGLINSVLTKEGHIHAKRLAKKLKDKQIDIAYASSLTRAKQTLKHILKYHPETKVFVNDRIIERDYGKLSRKSKEKYKKEHPKLYPIYHRSYDTPPPGGESIKQVENRVLDFIEELLYKMKKEEVNVLIVAHGNSIRPIRRYFENLTVDEMMKLENLRHKVFTYKIRLKAKK
jgi:2,3-bisphosphoglycerate-dependent phosphoglycerate mutase